MNTNEMIIDKVYSLFDVYHLGRLGGEKMPEDENPEELRERLLKYKVAL